MKIVGGRRAWRVAGWGLRTSGHCFRPFSQSPSKTTTHPHPVNLTSIVALPCEWVLEYMSWHFVICPTSDSHESLLYNSALEMFLRDLSTRRVYKLCALTLLSHLCSLPRSAAAKGLPLIIQTLPVSQGASSEKVVSKKTANIIPDCACKVARQARARGPTRPT